MSVESTLYATLAPLVPFGDRASVFRDIAPGNRKELPRITFQQIGGEAINFLSGDRPSKKRARFQINCWGERRDDVMALARRVEDAMRAETDLATTVIAAPIALLEENALGPDKHLYGSAQDFSVAYDD